MRIGIVTDCVDKRFTGIGYYTYNLGRSLIKEYIRLIIFTNVANLIYEGG